MKKQVKYKKYFVGYRTLWLKEKYLFCYKYQRSNLIVCLNIYSRESSFLFSGNSTIQFNQIKTDKRSKTDILMKLTKNLVFIAIS